MSPLAMKACLLVLALLASGCEAPPPADTLRLVMLEGAASGLALRELPGATLQSLGLPYGLAVVQAGGAGERAGLRVGDVVYGVNRTRVRSFEEFNRLVGTPPEGRVGLLVRRGKRDFYFAMDLGRPRAPDGPPRPPARDTLLST